MPKLLRWRAATWPDSPAFFRKYDGAWQPTSWGTVRDQVAALATGLADLGLKRGDRVAIHAENSPEWIYADMAANAAGGIVVGAYPSSSAVELRQLLQDSGASILFSENKETVAKVLPMLADCPSVGTIVVMNPGAAPADQKILTLADVMARGRTATPDRFDTLVDDTRATDVACIIYTSGTTGPPKGAMLTHRAAIAGAVTTALSLGMDANDVTIAYLPLCHLAERNLTLYVLPLIGHVVYFASSLKALPEETREVSPTFFGAVPRIAQKMQAQIEQDVAARGPWPGPITASGSVSAGASHGAASPTAIGSPVSTACYSGLARVCYTTASATGWACAGCGTASSAPRRCRPLCWNISMSSASRSGKVMARPRPAASPTCRASIACASMP